MAHLGWDQRQVLRRNNLIRVNVLHYGHECQSNNDNYAANTLKAWTLTSLHTKALPFRTRRSPSILLNFAAQADTFRLLALTCRGAHLCARVQQNMADELIRWGIAWQRQNWTTEVFGSTFTPLQACHSILNILSDYSDAMPHMKLARQRAWPVQPRSWVPAVMKARPGPARAGHGLEHALMTSCLHRGQALQGTIASAHSAIPACSLGSQKFAK